MYLEEVAELLNWYYDRVETDLMDPVDAPEGHGVYGTLFLLPSAPDELVKSAYRLLSMSYHPDRGGTTEQMSKLNSAYDEIKKERGL